MSAPRLPSKSLRKARDAALAAHSALADVIERDERTSMKLPCGHCENGRVVQESASIDAISKYFGSFGPDVADKILSSILCQIKDLEG